LDFNLLKKTYFILKICFLQRLLDEADLDVADCQRRMETLYDELVETSLTSAQILLERVDDAASEQSRQLEEALEMVLFFVCLFVLCFDFTGY
jgi:hypothetical protein